jgi:putative toxin-antitoxin system antitoxin component (TIGR02293 family)
MALLDKPKAKARPRANERDGVATHDRILSGVPFGVFEEFERESTLPANQLSEALMIPPSTLARRERNRRFKPDESERLLRLIRVYRIVLAFTGNRRDSALHWLREPCRALRDRKPLDLAKTEVGAREVENLIFQLDNGVIV